MEDNHTQASKRRKGTRQKRTLTEKRRKQNRAAQRTYRERRKERLEFLESLVPKGSLNHSDSKASKSSEAQPPQTQLDVSSSAEHDTFGITGPLPIVDFNASSSVYSFPPRSLADEELTLQDYPLLSSAPTTGSSATWTAPYEQVGIAPSNSSLTIANNLINITSATQTNLCDTHEQLSTLSFNWITRCPERARLVPDEDFSTGSMFRNNQLTPKRIENSQHTSDNPEPPSPSASIASVSAQSSAEVLRRLLQPDETTEQNELVTMAIQQKLPLKDILLAGLRSIKATTQPSHQAGFAFWNILPDPHANNIRLVREASCYAYSHNARIIGLSAAEVMNPDCASPFFHPHIEGGARGVEAVLASPSSRAITPHLQPIPAQVIHRHHPYLDLLPFPTFRARAIALAALDPPPFDRRELKRDILNDGLVCWRARGGSGQPWDMRSWEAAPWFLRKWWWLVGGEEGELWAQSGWWRGLRGEKASV